MRHVLSQVLHGANQTTLRSEGPQAAEVEQLKMRKIICMKISKNIG